MSSAPSMPVAMLWALVAGAGLALAFDPFGVWGGAVVAIAGASLLFSDTGARRRRTLLVGYVFGVAFFGVHLWWLTSSIALSAWLVVTLAQAAWFGLTAILVRGATGTRLAVPIAAAGWVTPELARRSWPFGGFPWGQIGFTAIDTPWASALPYLGVTGTSYLLALVGTSLAGVYAGGRARVLVRALPAVAVIGLSLLPAVLPFRPVSTGTATIAAVQGGVPGDGTDVPRYAREITRAHGEATVELAEAVDRGVRPRPEVVVWAENSTADDPFRNQRVRDQTNRAVSALDGPLVVGALVDGPTAATAYNQSVLWGPDGPAEQSYTKAHPVPFGEYIPFRSVLSGISSQLNSVPRDVLAGEDPRPLAVGSLRLAMAICFDIAFAEPLGDQVRAGGNVIVVQTSNATFTGTSQPAQQFTITRARALETGRSVVVASLNGISGLISPSGRVISVLPKSGTQTLVEEVATSSGLTPAIRFATPITVGIWLLTGVGIGARVLRSRSPRP